MAFGPPRLSGVSRAGYAPRCFEPADLPPGAAFIDVKVPVDQIARVHRFEALGFRLIDTGVQLTRAAGPLEIAGHAARFAVPGDEAPVRAIASRAITKSRFHLDPDIPVATSNRIKSDWAGNFFAGARGDWMVVAEDAGEVCGFLQLLKTTEGGVLIDLIGVAAERRNRGLGSQMMAFAARECLGHPAPLAVGTQMANVQSLALYQRLGFQIASASYVLHRHQRAQS